MSSASASSSSTTNSRVCCSIPNNNNNNNKKLKETIKNIKDITGKQHSDEDIYAMLQDCSMDPNDAVQRLLYLDTFREVKGKRERRKENVDRKTSEDGTWTQWSRGRGTRGGRGNYSSNIISQDTIGGKTAAAMKENGVSRSTAKGSPLAPQNLENKANSHLPRSSTVKVNGFTSTFNGSPTRGWATKAFVGGVNVTIHNASDDTVKLVAAPPPLSDDKKQHSVSVPGKTSVYASADQGKSTLSVNHLNKSGSSVQSSVSGPVLKLTPLPHHPGVMGEARPEEESQGFTSESEGSIFTKNSHIQSNQNLTQKVNDLDLNMTVAARETSIVIQEKLPTQSKGIDSDLQTPCPKPTSEDVEPKDAVSWTNVSVLDRTSKLHISDGQQVIFPNHFQIPEPFKHGLAFGSFDSSSGPDGRSMDSSSGDKACKPIADSCHANDEKATKLSLSNQSVSSTAQEADYHESGQSQSLPHLLETIPPSDGGDVSLDEVPKLDQSKQQKVLPERGREDPSVQKAANYNFGFLPPNQLQQVNISEPQIHNISCFPNFASGNCLVTSTLDPNPATSQPSGVDQSSIAPSPQAVPVLRHTYPLNYFPYSHYFPHYFVPPIPPFLGHAAFPPGQQPSPGNAYFPSAAAAATGIKYSNPQYKPGSHTGVQNHIGVPSAFGPYSSPAFPYSLRPAMISPSTSGDEDPVASHLKENIIYTTAQQTEGSGVWMPGTGQDISALQVNPFYNVPQGQPVTFPSVQATHGAFAGIYQSAQTIAAPQPSTVHPLQQSLVGSVKPGGHPPPSGSYQQPQSQSAQIHWTTAEVGS